MSAQLVLIESHRLQSIAAPLTPKRLWSETYVLHLANLPHYYAASASTPSNVIALLDKRHLQCLREFPGHQNATTSLRAVQKMAGSGHPILLSTGADGTVRSWDDRTGLTALSLEAPGKSLLCCDVSADGMTIAAGTEVDGEDAVIYYWDPRNGGVPLKTHSSTHSDDITAVRFNAESASPHPYLLSASSDGLLSVSDVGEDEEDDAVVYVGNWGCSISQAGWIYPRNNSGSSVWAASDMETFSTWTPELGLVYSIDIREPLVHNQRTTWVTDYFITGHSSSRSDRFGAFVGSNEGDIALITNPSLDNTSLWSLESIWSAGHAGVVRSVLWDEENEVLVTGGEDSVINVWPEIASDSMDIDDQD